MTERLERTLQELAGGRPSQLIADSGPDGVTDRLDLPLEPADVLVADIGNLFQHHVLDLGQRDQVQGIAGARVQGDGVAAGQAL